MAYRLVLSLVLESGLNKEYSRKQFWKTKIFSYCILYLDDAKFLVDINERQISFRTRFLTGKFSLFIFFV